MINEAQLDAWLEQWACEYGRDCDMPLSRACNPLQSLIARNGFAPSGGSPRIVIGTWADEVESAVRALELMRGEPGTTNQTFRAAMCLRECYLSPQYWPEEERLRALAKVGIAISRQTYYRAVQYARGYLRQALPIERAAA